MTNYEWIRSMKPIELAVLLTEFSELGLQNIEWELCRNCQYCRKGACCRFDQKEYLGCIYCEEEQIMKWLSLETNVPEY